MNSSEIQQICAWYTKGRINESVGQNFCQTRADFNARLVSYGTVLAKSLSSDYLYLVQASIGELGNNCFDHNLGHWQDDPGCLFIRGDRFCLVADRGRGVKASLGAVYQFSPGETSYLEVAFTKVVTGRAPEKRGNGLKFARKNIQACCHFLGCRSDHETYLVGNSQSELARGLLDPSITNSGTLTLIEW